MKSIVLYTEEIDDMELAMEELKAKLDESGFIFLQNTCGIAYCDSDTDTDELAAAFAGSFDFPIMGGTGMALLTKKEGYNVSGISLTILTADDCQFRMGMTEGLSGGNVDEEIRRTYKVLSEGLPEKEKLVFTVAAKSLLMGGDAYVNAVSEASDNVPVYGALASDRFDFEGTAVFCGGRREKAGLAMLLIAGNVHPIFAAEYSMTSLANLSWEITSCSGCTVYTLDGRPFAEVLEEAGLNSRNDGGEDMVMDFFGTPFMMEEKKENGDKVRKLRNLTTLNHKDKSGSFTGDMIEGATVHIGLMRKEDVQDSVNKTFNEVLARIKASGHTYSMFLCSSCGSRYLILSTEPDAEAKVYKELLPEGTELSGFYSYGEICPQTGKSGNNYNCILNDTFTILAI